MQKAIGNSVDDDEMEWIVECPECSKEHHYKGYFDSSDITECKCGCNFQTTKVYFSDGSYIY